MHLNVLKLLETFQFFSSKSEEELDSCYCSFLDGTWEETYHFFTMSFFLKCLVLTECQEQIPLRSILKNYQLWKNLSFSYHQELSKDDVIKLKKFYKDKLRSSSDALSCLFCLKEEWREVSQLQLDYQTFKKYEPYFVRLMKIEYKEKILPLLSSVIRSFFQDIISLNQQYFFFSSFELQSLIHTTDASLIFQTYTHVLEVLQSKTSYSLSSSLWNSFIPRISKEDFYKKEILECKNSLVDLHNVLHFLNSSYVLEECEHLSGVLEMERESLAKTL